VVPQNKALGEFLSEVGIPTALIKDIQIEEGDLEEAFLKIVSQKHSSAQVSP
jgi:ABC-2 type transport system ATP-binding protein